MTGQHLVNLILIPINSPSWIIFVTFSEQIVWVAASSFDPFSPAILHGH